TTPSFTLTGNAMLTFRAGAWDSSKESTSLTLTSDDATFTTSSFTLKRGYFSDYTTTVTGSGSVTITFEGSGRFFLDEVKVSAVATQIVEMPKTAAQNSRIYTLDGRFVGTSLETLPKGLYIVGGKKVVKI
nr:peptidase [Prevotella sp.]